MTKKRITSAETARDLDEWLEEVSVHGPEDRDNAVEAGNTGWPDGWWAVSDPDLGIVGYFLRETDAFRFRLDWINRKLNP